MARLVLSIFVALAVAEIVVTESLGCGHQACELLGETIVSEDVHEETLEASRVAFVQTRLELPRAKNPEGLEDAIKEAEAAGIRSLPWWNIVPSHPANYSYEMGGDIISLFAGSPPGDGPERLQKPEFFGYQDVDPVRDVCAPGAPGPVLANVATPELLAFMVDKNDAKRTDVGVIVIPGGGGNIVVWNYEGVEIAKWLNSIGISAFVLKYRVPAMDQYRGLPLIDVQRALGKLRHNAASMGLNASRIGTLGLSFGGGTSVDLSDSDERSYSAIDDADNADFRPDFQLLLYPGQPIRGSESLRRLQPPTFIASSRDDKCSNVEDVEAMAQAISRTGQEVVDVHIYSSGQHGYGNCKYTASGHFELVCNWLEEAAMFIRRYVLEEVW